MKDTEFIGQFKVHSNKLRISDPCYDKDTWCAGTIEDVKSGTWDANIKTVGGRVAELIAYQSDIKNETLKKSKWFEHDIEVGVDSGQCGIFDESLYPDAKTGEYDDENSFYGRCCNLTTRGVGTLDFGVVSSSGWGDGTYSCYTIEEKSRVVGVKIIFIEEEDKEDYDDYDEIDEMYQDDFLDDIDE